MKKKKQSNLSKVMSELGKLSHRKNPRPKSFYQNMVKRREALKRKRMREAVDKQA